eukprot:TRINITY_DN290_c3_g1_i1.p1 TRINITY_DN290_c3_g1~~TRINITY_DN290_c3_g1_i1.p1  ORF type:complete len:657 (+),score=199.09 TRINITY_DN290_c3_g1_i1:7-1977(+)
MTSPTPTPRAEASTRVFGVSLSDLLKRPSETGKIPSFVSSILSIVKRRGELSVDMLFKDDTEIKEAIKSIRTQIDGGNALDESSLEPHVAIALLRLYLKELPQPLLSFDLYSHFLNLTNYSNSPLYSSHIASLVNMLPKVNKELLQELLKFLYDIAVKSGSRMAFMRSPSSLSNNFSPLRQNSSTNVSNASAMPVSGQSQVTSSHLAMAFSPLLLRPAVESMDVPMNAIKATSLTKHLIENQPVIFTEHKDEDATKAIEFLDSLAKTQTLYDEIGNQNLSTQVRMEVFKRTVDYSIIQIQKRLDLMVTEIDSTTNLTRAIEIAQRVREAKKTLFSDYSETSKRVAQPLTGFKNPPEPHLSLHQGLVSATSGFESLQGKRKTMEDTHTCVDDLRMLFPDPLVQKRLFGGSKQKEGGVEGIYQYGFYAVYDGHSGIEAAEMAQEHLHKKITLAAPFAKRDFHKAIHQGILATDQLILETAREHGWKDGSTLALATLINGVVYFANLGDAEVILAHRGKDRVLRPISLTEIHKPTSASEQKRIEDLGGQIFKGRVFGSLAVSRALGDMEFKLPVGKANFVSNEPFIGERKLVEGDEFMIVSCDGLWEKMNYDHAIEFVGKLLDSGHDAAHISCLLAREAIDQGSADNVTVIIVIFKWDL